MSMKPRTRRWETTAASSYLPQTIPVVQRRPKGSLVGLYETPAQPSGVQYNIQRLHEGDSTTGQSSHRDEFQWRDDAYLNRPNPRANRLRGMKSDMGAVLNHDEEDEDLLQQAQDAYETSRNGTKNQQQRNSPRKEVDVMSPRAKYANPSGNFKIVPKSKGAVGPRADHLFEHGSQLREKNIVHHQRMNGLTTTTKSHFVPQQIDVKTLGKKRPQKQEYQGPPDPYFHEQTAKEPAKFEDNRKEYGSFFERRPDADRMPRGMHHTLSPSRPARNARRDHLNEVMNQQPDAVDKYVSSSHLHMDLKKIDRTSIGRKHRVKEQYRGVPDNTFQSDYTVEAQSANEWSTISGDLGSKLYQRQQQQVHRPSPPRNQNNNNYYHERPPPQQQYDDDEQQEQMYEDEQIVDAYDMNEQGQNMQEMNNSNNSYEQDNEEEQYEQEWPDVNERKTGKRMNPVQRREYNVLNGANDTYNNGSMTSRRHNEGKKNKNRQPNTARYSIKTTNKKVPSLKIHHINAKNRESSFVIGNNAFEGQSESARTYQQGPYQGVQAMNSNITARKNRYKSSGINMAASLGNDEDSLNSLMTREGQWKGHEVMPHPERKHYDVDSFEEERENRRKPSRKIQYGNKGNVTSNENIFYPDEEEQMQRMNASTQRRSSIGEYYTAVRDATQAQYQQDDRRY